MEDQRNALLYSRNVTEFVQAAGECCMLFENTLQFQKKDFIRKVHQLLPLLYLKGTLLPTTESIFDDENEHFVTEEEWFAVHDSIKQKLGYHDEYPEIFDPQTHEDELQSTASLADNFADIYQDLKNFLTLYHVGTDEIMNDALWEVRMNFEEFWGQKCVNAMRALHRVYYGEDDLSEEEEQLEQTNTDEDLENIDTTNWILTQRQADFNKEA